MIIQSGFPIIVDRQGSPENDLPAEQNDNYSLQVKLSDPNRSVNKAMIINKTWYIIFQLPLCLAEIIEVI